MPFRDIIGHDQSTKVLQAAIGRNRLAHAYLFHGPDRIGKRLVAIRFVQALLCDSPPPQPEADACSLCRSCRQVEAQTHPDFILIRPDPEQPNQQIKIEQIRAIEQQLIYRPLIGDRKICLLDDADRMTIGAANALLKTLEEPPDHSLFVLVSSRPSALPITIRSRCQSLRLAAPLFTQIESAMSVHRGLSPADARFVALLSEGQVGRALELDVAEERRRQREYESLLSPEALQSVSTLLTTAETLAKTDRAVEALAWLKRRLRDMLIMAVGGASDDVLETEPRHGPSVITGQADPDVLLDLLDEMDRLERQGHRHLNQQITLENILLRVRSLRTSAATVNAR